MRKVCSGLFSSIDGVVEAPDEWQPAFDEEMDAAMSRTLEGQDAVLMGRVTFTEFAGYWPTSTVEPFASVPRRKLAGSAVRRSTPLLPLLIPSITGRTVP